MKREKSYTKENSRQEEVSGKYEVARSKWEGN